MVCVMVQMLVAGTSGNMLEVRFHAASSLAGLLATQGHQQQARGLLRGKLEATSHHPYWHTRLLLQLAVSGTFSPLSGILGVVDSQCAVLCSHWLFQHFLSLAGPGPDVQ